MLERYFPALALEKVQDITPEILDKYNIKGIILDIDNTLVPQYTKEPDEQCIKWIENIRKAGYKLCIVSNASQSRVDRFNNKLSLKTIHRAFKPSVKSFNKGAELMGLKNENVAVVGDQIFTDIYGGNKAGMFTILVKPLKKKEFIYVTLKRLPEKLILSKYKKWLEKAQDKE